MDRRERNPESPDPLRPSRETLRETLVERQIREAMEEGAFDSLPHQGRRLPLEDDSAAGAWALAHRMLKNAGVAPPWIETDKEVRRLMERRTALLERAGRARPLGRSRLRSEFRDLIEALDAAIVRLNVEAPTDRQHRRRPDVAAELAELEAALDGRPHSQG